VEFNEIQADANVVKISPAKGKRQNTIWRFTGSGRDVKALFSLPTTKCGTKFYKISLSRAEVGWQIYRLADGFDSRTRDF
jgi:hypothetical protein